MIFENKVVHKLKLLKKYFYKKRAPKLVYFKEKTIDIKNSLRNSDFDTF